MDKPMNLEKNIPLDKIILNTRDAFGENKEFITWNSANQFLKLYTAKYWEHEDERIHFHIQWVGNYTVSGSFLMPNEEIADNQFLEGIVQDYIQGKLLIPIHLTSASQFDKLTHSVSFLSEYIGFNSASTNSYDQLLSYGEGMNNIKYQKDRDSLKASLARLFEKHPYLTDIFDEAKSFYTLIPTLKNRTHFFKEYLLREGKRDITKALDATITGDDDAARLEMESLKSLINRIREENNIVDERHTQDGMTIYQIYPLDLKEIPSADTPFNDFLSKDMRDRILHVRTAVIADSSQPEHTIFYSCYQQCLENVLQLPFEKRSHRMVSRMVFNQLRLYNISKSRRVVLIDLYDPFSVGITGYGKNIREDCELEAAS
ncbi:hypothetical protein [Selenomonas ruminantium]|uniref:hypothetical protein n=1 Tax=Selenomonas ruminantium TaxID=971 RepID=UPI0026EE569E|nr:hypothetical protein [Selenomonas ruminantium]